MNSQKQKIKEKKTFSVSEQIRVVQSSTGKLHHNYHRWIPSSVFILRQNQNNNNNNSYEMKNEPKTKHRTNSQIEDTQQWLQWFCLYMSI